MFTRVYSIVESIPTETQTILDQPLQNRMPFIQTGLIDNPVRVILVASTKEYADATSAGFRI